MTCANPSDDDGVDSMSSAAAAVCPCSGNIFCRRSTPGAGRLPPELGDFTPTRASWWFSTHAKN
jgi:hypothetical protein